MSDSIGRLSVGSFLKDLQAALDALGALEKLNVTVGLIEQVGDLHDIARCFDDLATTERRNPSVHLKFYLANDLVLLQKVVASTDDVIKECHPLVWRIRDSIDEIVNERQQDIYITTEGPLENQVLFDEIHLDLKLRTETLKALFKAVSLLHSQHVTAEDAQSLEARSRTSTQLHYQIGVVEKELGPDGRHDTDDVQEAVAAARAVTVSIPSFPNKHFVISRPVRDYFTGRETQLGKLDVAFRNPTRATQQRFVIYGLSGSGKKELAFKFADRARHKFWGVFFVDGSSRKKASSSYADIATLGGAEPNEKAAKNWLMMCAYPWLLIVDNVDDEEIIIDELLPAGTKGCILITTRNPRLKTYGNAGESSLELLVMEPNEAEVLLTQAAEEPRPLTKLLADSACSICQALGYLPLALVQAAKAILTDICGWPEYLTFWDRQIQRIRRNKHASNRSRSGERGRMENDENSINVFSTYEILYESLKLSPKEKCQDAVELLHVFSFFHFQNIRLDVLINSAINPLKEEEQLRKDEKQEKELQGKLATPSRKPWLMFLRELRAFVNGKLLTPVPLPNVLRNRDGLNLSDLEVEVKDRLRYALSVLIERSLVTRQDRATDRYSMHWLVHKWVRERPEMSTSHQALWCQVSMTTLASSIRRPPHGNEEIHARRELLPHIRHVSECQAVLEERLEESVKRARPIFLVKKSYGRLQAEQDVRFSRVYSETGHFKNAQELQERALEYVSGRLGPDHPVAIQLSLLLSMTLWEMSKMGKATQRQRRALQLCISTWGEDHPLTLDVTDMLGSALCMNGRWGEATALHTANVEKMKRLYGNNHEKTLRSMRNLGRVQHRHMNFEEATRLHQIAWEGMRDILGPNHLETLISLEDLSMSYLRYEEEDPDPYREEQLAQSHQNQTLVYEQRKKQLGEEHPYTLLAILLLARLKSALGHHEEAETMIRLGLEVAERNIGKGHLAVLMARTIYAVVLTELGKFAQAENIFYYLIDKARYTEVTDEEGDHPDRLSNLYLLAKCLNKQGKLKEELEICEEFLTGLATINGNGLGMKHKMVSIMQKKRAYLMEKIQQVESGTETGEAILIDV